LHAIHRFVAVSYATLSEVKITARRWF